MATYTRKHCPNCDKIYQSYSSYTKHMNVESGCPIVMCKHCGTYFIDNDIKEPAFSDPPKSLNVFSILLAPLYPLGLAGGFFIFLGVKADNVICLIIGVLSLLLYAYLVCVGFKNRFKIDAEITEEYEASLKRLKDKEYIVFLIENGYKMPQKFLSANYPDLLFLKPSRKKPLANSEDDFLDEEFVKEHSDASHE